MDATQVAVAVEALYDVLAAAMPAEVQVTDGPTLDELEQDLVMVGYSETRAAVEIEQTREGLGPRRAESMSVVCQVSIWRGDPDVKAARVRAVAVLNLVGDAIAADRRLGGLVRRAELGTSLALDQVNGEVGVFAALEFDVRIDVV